MAAWLSQQFFLQWTFSSDTTFLRQRAIPWTEGVATHLEGLLKEDGGFLELEISSSPEFHDNSLAAWCLDTMTNYDRGLCRYVFNRLVIMHSTLGQTEKANKYFKLLTRVDYLDTGFTDAFTVAPNEPYAFSHRHFSHLLPVFPLALVDTRESRTKTFIANSIVQLEKYGASDWTGYSHAWLANLYARQGRGDDAAKQLRDFAQCYCSPNSFHLNGNQCLDRTDLSNMHYRPFTLEGNFAAAAGVQAMLLQSCNGLTEVFPAVPKTWLNVEFETLRAEGGFLISAKRQGGITDKITITATQNGTLWLVKPFFTMVVEDKSEGVTLDTDDKVWDIIMKKGDRVILQNGYE